MNKKILLGIFFIIFFGSLIQANPDYKNNSIVYHDSGPFGEVLVYKGAVENAFAGGHISEGEQDLFLYTDYIRQCSSSWEDYYNHLIDCCYMNFNNKSNMKVLNVGLGCGIVAGKVADFNNVNKIDVVEINPLVIEASKDFSKYNNNLHSNPKVEIINDDGFDYVKKTDSKYDHVIIEINNAVIAYASNLYTKEAFSNIKNILSENGTFTLWTGVGTSLDKKENSQEYKYLRVIYYTLKKEFNNVYYLPEGRVFVASDSEFNINKRIENTEKTIKINRFFDNDTDREINTLEYQPILKYIKNINQSIEYSRSENKKDLYQKVKKYKNERDNIFSGKTIFLLSFIFIFSLIVLTQIIYLRRKK